MFGNLAALGWCTSYVAPSFQLQGGTPKIPISLQFDPLSCMLDTYGMRELSANCFRTEVSLLL